MGSALGSGASAAKSSSTDTPSSWAKEYSVATDGWDLPFSICDTKDGDTPSSRAAARRDSPALVRASRSRGPSWLIGIDTAPSLTASPYPYGHAPRGHHSRARRPSHQHHPTIGH